MQVVTHKSVPMALPAPTAIRVEEAIGRLEYALAVFKALEELRARGGRHDA